MIPEHRKSLNIVRDFLNQDLLYHTQNSNHRAIEANCVNQLISLADSITAISNFR